MAVIFVTHDLGVVADLCSRVIVMYAGQVVEEATVEELFARPRHPYTEGLLAAIPQAGVAGERLASIPGVVPAATAMPTGCRFHPRCPYAIDECDDHTGRAHRGGRRPPRPLHPRRRAHARGRAMSATPPADTPPPGTTATATGALLSGTGVTKHFPIRRGVLRRTVGHVRAVDGVDLAVEPGRTLGLVGESGSGKSTIGRVLLRLLDPTAGTITFDGNDITKLPSRQMRSASAAACSSSSRTRSRRSTRWRRSPTASPNRCATTSTSTSNSARRGSSTCCARCSLDPDHRNRYPREFSGGQLQRIAIARALALVPQAARARRAGEQPRRVDPGRHHQPARRPAGGARPRLPLHRPRPRGRAPRERPHRGHVPRPDRGTGSGRGGVRPPEAPVHRGAAVGDPRPQPGTPTRAGADRARG